MPHFVLLGGMINGTLYTRNGILNYAKLPSIDDLRSQLVALLNMQLASLPQTLDFPIQHLSLSLKQHAESSTSKTDEK